MSVQTEPVASNDDKTVIGRACPRCNTINPMAQIAQQGYSCKQCGFELAYLDYTATGGVRQVLGWVQNVGGIIHDRYQVQAVLGRGGFGSTYLVSDLRLNGRRRALKEIPPNMFDDQEPMLLSKLTHPGIPDITDHFEYNNLVCLVLEFGGTHTMESKRKEFDGKIPAQVLLPWLCQLCDILEYLHTRNPPIIHRDLKPGNILLDENDRIRLIDFGIAKVANPTEATHTLGRAISQGFSSPEQIAGTGTDHRSDIYGLGATAYFLLSGVHPPSLTDRLSDKTMQRLIDLVPGLPPELDLTISKALDLNPVKRQQSVKELWDVFTALSPKSKPPKIPSAGQSGGLAKGKSRLLIGIVAFVALAAVIAAGVYYFRQQGEMEKQAKSLVPNTQDQPSLSPSAPPEKSVKTVERPPAPATSPPAQSGVEAKQGLPSTSDTGVVAPAVTPPPASTMEQREQAQQAEPKSAVPEVKPVEAGASSVSGGGSGPVLPKEDVPPVETKSITPSMEQPPVSAPSKEVTPVQPTVLEMKKTEVQASAPPKKKEVPAQPKQTKRTTNSAPSASPQAPPAKEQKPAADWGGAMKWQESQ